MMLEASYHNKQAMTSAGLERIAIPDADIELWLARLDLDANVVSQYANRLSTDERERARRFHFEHDRRRFAVARGTLRILLGEHLGIDPKLIKFTQTEKGKPSAIGTSIHFNVSHSHERVLIAISNNKPVGVDIEYLAREVDYAALAARYFTPNEYSMLRNLPETQRKRAFLVCWTCKEAVAKAIGEGLFASFGKFEVAVLPGLTVAKQANNHALHKMEVGDDYVAAVAAPAK